MRTKLKFFLVLALIASFTFYSCSSDDNEVTDNTTIPSDSEAQANPKLSATNTAIPNPLFTTEENSDIVSINLTGIQHPETKEWLQLHGTSLSAQNIWVEVDGVAKGILVFNNSASTTKSTKLYADLVFLVDNSGSMGQEADSVANGISKWATNLSKQGIDIQFGCVGYEMGVNGALDLSNLSDINNYLNRKNRYGVSRTKAYADSDSLRLLNAAKNYRLAYDECGVEALHFANENFTFRKGASRIYVNFTDEPNQPNRKEKLSVEYIKDQNNWNTALGTIHTVFSGDTTFTVKPLQIEKPWLLSNYTGGTKMFVAPSFQNVTLDNLPITGAMVNSYVIKFKNNSELANGTHEVKITVLSTDQKVKAEKIFKNVKFGN